MPMSNVLEQYGQHCANIFAAREVHRAQETAVLARVASAMERIADTEIASAAHPVADMPRGRTRTSTARSSNDKKPFPEEIWEGIDGESKTVVRRIWAGAQAQAASSA